MKDLNSSCSANNHLGNTGLTPAKTNVFAGCWRVEEKKSIHKENGIW